MATYNYHMYVLAMWDYFLEKKCNRGGGEGGGVHKKNLKTVTPTFYGHIPTFCHHPCEMV